MKKTYQAPRIERIIHLPHRPLLQAGSYKLNDYTTETEQTVGGDE
jgi:hypothetical protein